MSTGLSHYDRYIREVDRDSAERKYQRKEDFADVSNVVTAANSAVTFVHNLNSPTQTNKLNVFWEILGSRHDGSGDASISLEFQSGDTVTSDSIQLRVRNLGRNISVDHPMTLLVRFSRATPWILALMLLSYPSHALVDCDGAGQAINYNLTTNTFGCVSGLGGGGGAPTGASYITQVTEAGLSAEQNLAVLSSGIMFSTTGTGVVSTLVPHAGTDVTADLEEEGVTCTGCIAAAEIANDVIAPDQLSDTQTLDANLQWSMGAYTMTFTVANPASGGIDINGTGAYTGDLLHVHQHVGNAGAGNLVHMEAADPDVTPLLHVEALAPSATGVADAIVGLLIDTDDDNDASFRPILVQDDNAASPDDLFAVDYTGTITTPSVGAAAVTAGAIAATTDFAGALCGTNEILEDQGAAWACIATPVGGGGDSVTVDPGTGDVTYTDINLIEGSGITFGVNLVPAPDELTISLGLDTIDSVTFGTGTGLPEMTFASGGTGTGTVGHNGSYLLVNDDLWLTSGDDSATIRLDEAAANGSNYLEFDVPAAVATSRTCTFEDGTDASFIPDSCVGDGTDDGSAISAWPIGSVFISVVSTNPNTLLGGGTWAAIGTGRVLVGIDTGDTNFDVVEETGGSKTVASSAQTFAGSSSTVIVNHTHQVNVGSANDTSTVSGSGNNFAGTTNTVTATTGNPVSGGAASYTPAGTNTPGAATSVVQPYLVVYMWKRTA